MENVKKWILFVLFSVGGFIVGYDAIPVALGNNDTLIAYLMDVFGELPVTAVVAAGLFWVRKYL